MASLPYEDSTVQKGARRKTQVKEKKENRFGFD
jgi:hypothetical protein